MGKFKPVLLISIPEFILLLLVYLGIFFKMLHLPIANLTLTILLLTLATLYLTLGALIHSNIDIRKLNVDSGKEPYVIIKIIYGFFGGLAMSIFTVGCWARVLHLPVERAMIPTSLVLLIILAIIAIVICIRYPRFLFVLTRLLISFIMVAFPFYIWPY